MSENNEQGGQIELLPCPFCGPGESVVSLWLDYVAHRFRVGCGRCGCSTGISPRDRTEAPAIASWNTRAPLASLNVSDTSRELIEQIIERDRKGLAKYGTTLDRTDLTPEQWLQHMAEELMDGAGYALAAIRTLRECKA